MVFTGDPLKVLMVVAFFPPNHIGGAEMSAYQLARALSRRGLDVHVTSPDHGNPEACNEFASRNPEIRLHYLRFPKIRYTSHARMRLATYNPLYILYLTFWIIRIHRGQGIDLVHAFQNEDDIPSRLACAIAKTPFIATVNDFRFLCEYVECFKGGGPTGKCGLTQHLRCSHLGPVSKLPGALRIAVATYLFLYSLMNRWALEGAEALIFISRFLASLGVGNLAIRRIAVISQIATTEEAQSNAPETGPEVIAFAGRMDPRKGLSVLIKAFSIVAERRPGVFLVVMGDIGNDYGQGMKHLSEDLGVSEAVTFTGPAQHHEVLQWFAAAKVVAIPSIWPEPQGRVALEAIGVGTPVVASDIGGLRELITERDGLVVTPDDPERLAAALLQVLEERAIFKPGYAERRFMDTDWITSSIAKMYRAALNGFTGGGN